MATFKYFSGNTQLTGIHGLDNAQFAGAFPEVKGFRYDGFKKLVGQSNGVLMPVTRCIEYKSNPSKHKCDARCLNGKVNGICECSCGGANHGAGH